MFNRCIFLILKILSMPAKFYLQLKIQSTFRLIKIPCDYIE